MQSQDADLVCEPTEQVRKIDVERGRDFEISVGKVVSPDVKVLIFLFDYGHWEPEYILDGHLQGQRIFHLQICWE